ncbi:MAG: hypothetical protein ABSE07_06970 [Methanoregula sp.]|jgi:hypothetical protein
MDSNSKILLVLGAGITIILLFVNIYLAGIVCVLFITLLMSLQIMQDSRGIPDIVAKLREDAKGVILTNTGNARAEKIHVALVPGNIEFDTPPLDPDSTYEYRLDAMVEEIKVVVTYANENGRKFSGSSRLSVFGNEPDLLKPLIPIFK